MKCENNRTCSVLANRQLKPLRDQRHAGFTLVEIMVAVFLLGMSLAAFYGAFISGLGVLRVTRENLRAAQILEERMEVIRLIKWDDVAPGFIPTSFAASYDGIDGTKISTHGFVYQGTVTITNAPISEKYAGDLRMIQVELTWKSGNIRRTRQMTTYVSKYGLQNHIY